MCRHVYNEEKTKHCTKNEYIKLKGKDRLKYDTTQDVTAVVQVCYGEKVGGKNKPDDICDCVSDFKFF